MKSKSGAKFAVLRMTKRTSKVPVRGLGALRCTSRLLKASGTVSSSDSSLSSLAYRFMTPTATTANTRCWPLGPAPSLMRTTHPDFFRGCELMAIALSCVSLLKPLLMWFVQLFSSCSRRSEWSMCATATIFQASISE